MMSKSIYMYINEEDIKNILTHLSEAGLQLFDELGQQLLDLPFLSDFSLNGMKVFNQDKEFVFYTPCHYLPNNLIQPGSLFLLEDKCPANSTKFFSKMKKAILKECTYDKASMLYYGNGFYRDWLADKYPLPLLLDCYRSTIPAKKINILLRLLENSKFRIHKNFVPENETDIITSTTRNFIIYSDESKLRKTYLERPGIIRYDYGSSCIFVSYHENKKNFCLVLDVRYLDKTPELLELFNRLQNIDWENPPDELIA